MSPGRIDEELLASMPEYAGKTLYEVLFQNGQVDRFPVEQARELNDESHANGFYVQKGLFEEPPHRHRYISGCVGIVSPLELLKVLRFLT